MMQAHQAYHCIAEVVLLKRILGNIHIADIGDRCLMWVAVQEQMQSLVVGRTTFRAADKIL
jgi:hypothetical protein